MLKIKNLRSLGKIFTRFLSPTYYYFGALSIAFLFVSFIRTENLKNLEVVKNQYSTTTCPDLYLLNPLELEMLLQNLPKPYMFYRTKDSQCHKVGDLVKITTHSHPLQIGTARISEVKNIKDNSEALKDGSNLFESASQYQFIMNYFEGSQFFQQPLVAVTLDQISITQFSPESLEFIPGLTPGHSVTIVDNETLIRMSERAKSQTLIFQNQDELKALGVQQHLVRYLPYQINPNVLEDNVLYGDLADSLDGLDGDTFAWNELPANHQAPIFILTTGPNQARVRRLIISLINRGYDNVFVSFYNKPGPQLEIAEIPKSFAGINVIEREEALTLVQKKSNTVLFDIRTRLEFALTEKEGIKGSVNLPYYYLDWKGPVYSTDTPMACLKKGAFDPATIQLFHDELKNVTPVIFGKNQYDLRALKTALVLAAIGKKVYLYRGGSQDWMRAQLFNQKMNKSSSNK